MKLSFHKYAFALLASLALVSCAKDYALVGAEREKGREPIWLSTRVTVQGTRASGRQANPSLSTSASTDMDSRVFSLRMIISDSQTGVIIYNEKTTDPQELEDRFSQTSGENATWRRPIKITPGTYDFWFVANEGTNWFAPVSGNHDRMNELGNQVWDKLTPGTHIARIFDGKVFTGSEADLAPLAHLDIAPYRKYAGRLVVWEPKVDLADKALNYPMPMSAVYRNVEINNIRNNKGTSEQDPQHFIAGGDEVVKLVRCMAKVTYEIKKATRLELSGNKVVPKPLEWPVFGPFATLVLNRPRYWSFFNTPLFEMNHTPRQFKFYDDIFADDQSRIPMVRMSSVGRNAYVSSDIIYDRNDVSQSATDLKTYRCSFYVPELLLERHPLDGEPNGGFSGARNKSVLLALAPKSAVFANERGYNGRTLWTDDPAEGNFSPFANEDDFNEKVDECKVLGIGTMDLTERNDNTDNPKLPNPQWYSKFSLLRNRHYVYTISEKDRMVVDVRIEPWETNLDEGEVHSFDEFQVEVLDPSFSNATKKTKLRFQMTFGKNSNGYNRHNFEKVKFTLLDQNGGVNQQAYFSNLGNVQPMQAESGNKPKWVAFGNWEDVHFDGGFAECEINWAEASGVNQPGSGKNILKVEFFADPEMTRLVKDSSPLYISVRDANWKEEFRRLK